MTQKLKFTDILALGLMLFAFFLGAGNIIFPPPAGQLAGEHVSFAMTGFLLTAVGLPLLSVIAVAISGGSWQAVSRDLPTWAGVSMAVLMFIIIGPAFAVPRTAGVAYRMAVKPWLDDSFNGLPLFSIIFFGVAVLLALKPGKLIDTIGKLLTPILFGGLIVLAVGVFMHPLGTPLAAQGSYINFPLTTGFLEGYQTMDTFGALLFGMLMIDAIGKRGIREPRLISKYLIYSGVIAAVGLGFVYISLFYLGATSSGIAGGLTNGGDILSVYVQTLFGSAGQWVLTIIVSLACLTTAIGLISACSEYFAQLTKIRYSVFVVGIGSASAFIANIGLDELIALSRPVLFALYPTAVMLVLMAFIRHMLKSPKIIYRSVITVCFIFSLLDALSTTPINIDGTFLSSLPLYQENLTWLLPTVGVLLFMVFTERLWGLLFSNRCQQSLR